MGLSHPIRTRVHECYGNERSKVAVASMCGFRVSMEVDLDAHTVVLSMPLHPNAAFVGVYDGHGGQAAARFCAQTLSGKIDVLPDWSDETLRRAIEAFDFEFCSPDNANREHGTTCVFALIEWLDDSVALTVCNTGDSRALLGYRSAGHKDVFDPLTVDHKPGLQHEMARILKAGGFVTSDRVDGDLALSRAIGDWKYKCNSDLKMDEQKVIAVPDVTRRLLRDDLADAYLLVACDGIFERMSDLEVHHAVCDALARTGDPLEAVDHLLKVALDSGSKDNMSAALMLFEDGRSFHGDKPTIKFGPIFPENSTFMSSFYRFCEEAGFAEEAKQHVSQWLEEHGGDGQMPEPVADDARLSHSIIERFIAGANPVLVNENGQPRLILHDEFGEETGVIDFNGLQQDP